VFFSKRERDQFRVVAAADGEHDVLLAAVHIRHRRGGRAREFLVPDQFASLLVVGAELRRFLRRHRQLAIADLERGAAAETARILTDEQQRGSHERTAARTVAERTELQILQQRMIPRTVTNRHLPGDGPLIQIDRRDTAIRWLVER
jgi:hypothetical protein